MASPAESANALSLKRHERWLPWIAAAAVLGSALMFGLFEHRQHSLDAEDRFADRVDKFERALRDRVRSYENLLRSGDAMFSHSHYVGPHEWTHDPARG